MDMIDLCPDSQTVRHTGKLKMCINTGDISDRQSHQLPFTNGVSLFTCSVEEVSDSEENKIQNNLTNNQVKDKHGYDRFMYRETNR